MLMTYYNIIVLEYSYDNQIKPIFSITFGLVCTTAKRQEENSILMICYEIDNTSIHYVWQELN